MNILPHLHFQPLEELSIRVKRIYAGWMDITLSNKEKSFEYSASYLTDPLEEILYCTILLLNKKPVHVRGNWYLKDSAVIYHDLEGRVVVWLLHHSNDVFSLMIWDNIDPDALESLANGNFDMISYNRERVYNEDLPDLSTDLLFAFCGSPIHFAKTLKETLENVTKTFIVGEDESDWGIRYSIEDFNALNNWITENY